MKLCHGSSLECGKEEQLRRLQTMYMLGINTWEAKIPELATARSARLDVTEPCQVVGVKLFGCAFCGQGQISPAWLGL